MSIAKKRLQILGAVLVVLSSAWSCGKGSNNDQGAAFTNVGYYVKDGDSFSPSTGASFEMYADDHGLHSPSKMLLVGMAAVNRLAKQYINVKRVDCSYEIPGADPALHIPRDSTPMSVFLTNTPYPPSGIDLGSVEDPAVGALSGDVEIGNSAVFEYPMLSSEFVQFLNVNRNLLPKMPFLLIATCNAVGVTQAGDTLETNSTGYPIEVKETTECCGGTEAFRVGSGIGGDVTSYDPNGETTTVDPGSSSLGN